LNANKIEAGENDVKSIAILEEVKDEAILEEGEVSSSPVAVIFEVKARRRKAKKESNEYKRLECKVCGKRLKSLDSLNKHTASVHEDPELKIKIDPYKEIMEPAPNPIIDIAALVRRISNDPTEILTRRVKLTANRCYKCEYCNALFPKVFGLKNHTEIKHPTNFDSLKFDHKHETFLKYPYYKCSECPNSNNNPAEFIDHIVKHQQETFNCEACPFKCRRVKQFKSHVLNHKTKDVLCKDCGESFIDVFKLKEHKGKVHPLPKVLKRRDRKNQKKPTTVQHICEVCAKEFYIGSRYKLHVLQHSDPTYTCTQCERRFHRKEGLRKHSINIHKEHHEKKFQCDQCGKGFNVKISLKNHMNVHLGLKPFKCRNCDKCYQNPENKIAHEKKNHPGLFKG